MLKFSPEDAMAKEIAKYYCNKINNSLAGEFFSGQRGLSTKDEALAVAKAFWQMADLASGDHINNVDIMENADIEFWMYKLFNKTLGYFQTNGFMEEWKAAETENS